MIDYNDSDSDNEYDQIIGQTFLINIYVSKN